MRQWVRVMLKVYHSADVIQILCYILTKILRGWQGGSISKASLVAKGFACRGWWKQRLLCPDETPQAKAYATLGTC